jgi:hypothetical protein
MIYKFPSHLQVKSWKNRYNLLLKAIKNFRKLGGSFFAHKIKTLVTQSNYQLVELVGIAPASNDYPQ